MNRFVKYSIGALVAIVAAVLAGSVAAADLVVTSRSAVSLTKAYGFLVGQDQSLRRIERAYPDLKVQVEYARRVFGSTFSGTKESLASNLTRALGSDNFQKLEADISKAIAGTLATQPISRETSETFLGTVRARAKGDQIEEDVLRSLLAVRYLKQPTSEYIDGFVQRYVTDGSGKSRGLRLRLRVPRSWAPAEGERPHIVQKWTSQAGWGSSTVMLDVRDFEGSAPGRADIADMLKDKDLFAGLGEQVRLLRAEPITLERQNGYRADLAIYRERAGNKLYARVTSYQIYFRGKALGIMCWHFAKASEPQKADSAAEEMNPLCEQVVNSLVLEQAY